MMIAIKNPLQFTAVCWTLPVALPTIWSIRQNKTKQIVYTPCLILNVSLHMFVVTSSFFPYLYSFCFFHNSPHIPQIFFSYRFSLNSPFCLINHGTTIIPHSTVKVNQNPPYIHGERMAHTILKIEQTQLVGLRQIPQKPQLRYHIHNILGYPGPLPEIFLRQKRPVLCRLHDGVRSLLPQPVNAA